MTILNMMGLRRNQVCIITLPTQTFMINIILKIHNIEQTDAGPSSYVSLASLDWPHQTCRWCGYLYICQSNCTDLMRPTMCLLLGAKSLRQSLIMLRSGLSLHQAVHHASLVVWDRHACWGRRPGCLCSPNISVLTISPARWSRSISFSWVS